MKEQFPRLFALTGGSFNEVVLRGLEYDLEFQITEVKIELHEYRLFQKELDKWRQENLRELV
jgi:hypothetical protein